MSLLTKQILIILSLLMGFLPLWGSEEHQRLEHYLSERLAGRSSGSDLRCGLYYPLLLTQSWEYLNPALKNALGSPYLTPPQLQDSVLSPSGFFMIHFDRSGFDAVPEADLTNNGIPDYIDSAGVILDFVRYMEVYVLGFQAPLGLNGEPVPLYHVYFQNLGFEYGATFPQEPIPGPPLFFRFTSYIVMDNDYQDSNYFSQGLEALKVTAAHEFHHAIQFSYRIWINNSSPVDLFLMEMTSTWLEDVLFEDINDYLQYLPFFFANYSNVPFTSTDFLNPFGNCLFLHMLEKQFGTAIGRELWEKITEQPGLEALKIVLEEANTSFVSQLHQYGLWLSFTGERADSLNFFPEGSLYPELLVDPDDLSIFDPPLSESRMITPLATRMLQFDQTTGGEYLLTVNSNRTPGKVSHLTSQGIISTISVNQSGLLYLLTGENAVVFITNASEDTADVKYQLARGGAHSPGSIVAFPNPVIFPRDQNLAFINIPEAGEIYILNSNGRRVARLTAPSLASTVIWNLKDDHDREVVSGTYLYLFKGAKTEKTGKIAIIR